MKDLIKLLEEATGPNRDLDWKIWFKTADKSADHGTDGWPKYTSSLDDALTLVPDGLTWNAGITDEHFEGPIIATAQVLTREFTPEGWRARGATPAIALCIAALAARSAQTEG